MVQINENIEDEYEGRLYKILKKFAFISRQFCDKYCIPDGLIDIAKFNSYTHVIPNKVLYSSKLSYDYDYDYYAFTKSTKTLHAIWLLLRDRDYRFNEDVIMLTRSIFENHILSRYFREHVDIEVERNKVIREFIKNPLGVALNYYFREGYSIKKNNGEVLGKVKNPSNYKLSKENEYYNEFYPFLCEFAHCSFARIDCYFDGHFFCYDKKNYKLETILFVIFVFTKIFEGVATVEGENFDTENEEDSYYDLVYDSLELQEEVFNYLIKKYDTSEIRKETRIVSLYLDEKSVENPNYKMKSMLEKMKDSLLDDEIGSVRKQKDKSGKFIRQYPENN